MANGDYGYFGKGDTGYAQYMTAFNHIVTGNTNNIPMEDLNMKAKFYICEHCGNLITTIHNAGVPLVCCGEKMKELLPNTVEASGEKHLPVAELSGSTLTVTVGAVEHPIYNINQVNTLLFEYDQEQLGA